MLERMSIKNYRCFKDFSIDFSGLNSCVILGRNGAGKTTVGLVLQILQRMANQTSRVGELIKPTDISEPSDSTVRFEIDVRLSEKKYTYGISFELPDRFRELRVSEEQLSVDDAVIFSRQTSQIALKKSTQSGDTTFGVDWHIVALPIIQTLSSTDPIAIFKKWLSSIVILRPVPSVIRGESDSEALLPKSTVEDFGEWFSGVLVANPSSYEPFIGFLREVMPDISSVRNPNIGPDSRSVEAEFKYEGKSISIQLGRLSDGEKCFFVCALVIAMASETRSLTCFWDEPDNYLAPQEVSSTMLALRRAFKGDNQIILTSHNPDAIRCFTDENTIILSRDSHLTSPRAFTLSALRNDSNSSATLDLWLRGDLEV